MVFFREKARLPDASEALAGRTEKIPVVNQHFVKQTPICPPFPEGMKNALFGLGCFWGVERKFWEMDGVYSTAVGYAFGYTPNPSYEEVCSGMTGHAEVVLVIYDPNAVTYEDLLSMFWSSHDPTQGMRQGNDLGTQYRSIIGYYDPHQKALARESMEQYETMLVKSGGGAVTTDIMPAADFFYAETYHQQYLAKRMG